MAMCRNLGYWSNADSFNPDRFPVDGPIPNEVTEAYNYLPFGGGRRKCIGEPRHFSELPGTAPRTLYPWRQAGVALHGLHHGQQCAGKRQSKLLRKYCRGNSQGDALGWLSQRLVCDTS